METSESVVDVVVEEKKPRVRAKTRKSKGGCLTCRIRHIKCDEKKPACKRCLSTGRVCDGYSISYQHNSSTTSTAFPSALSVLPDRTKNENRYFEYFLNNAVLGLVGFDHGSQFWTETVLQLSQSSPAVLHAIVSLAALHEYLENGLNDIGSRRVFLQQYNKAIVLLRGARNRGRDIQTTLICCVLFIVLEMAEGNITAALEHLRSGLKILKGWKIDPGSFFLEREVITNVLRRLDMQATVFLNSRRPELNDAPAVYDSSTSGGFSTLQEAHLSLEVIIARLLSVLTNKSSLGIELPIDLLQSTRKPLLEVLAAQFRQWKVSFDIFSASRTDTMQIKDLQMSVVLGLHHQTMSLMLDVKAVTDEDIRVHDARLFQILALSRSLINSHNSKCGKFRLSADTGVIGPLYYASMIASNPAIRQEAINLLRQVRWREGFWDAATVAQIAEKVEKVKRDGVLGVAVTGGVPELVEVHVAQRTNHSVGIPDYSALPGAFTLTDSWALNRPSQHIST